MLSLVVVVKPEGFACLIAGSTAFLTCNTVGYPRPRLVFTKNSNVIEPGASDRITHDIWFNEVCKTIVLCSTVHATG